MMRCQTTTITRSRTLLLTALFFGAGPGASADVSFVVPEGVTELSIPDEDLLAGEFSVHGIPSKGPAGRGSLNRVSGGVVYQPGPDFWALGSDSFEYEIPLPDGEVRQETAFLVAAMQGQLYFSEKVLFDGALAALTMVGDVSRMEENTVSPIEGVYDIRLDLDGEEVFIEIKDIPPGHNPRGGKLAGGIDPGNSVWVQNSYVELATALGPKDTALCRVVLDSLNFAPVLSIEVYEGADTHRSESVTLGAGDRFEVQYWLASAPGARDGGALLWVNGEVAGRLEGIDRYEASFDGWRLGAVDKVEVHGLMYLDVIEAEIATTVPRLRSEGADHFATGIGSHWDGFSCGGPLPTTSLVTHLGLSLSPAAPHCALKRVASKPLESFRVRFRVDPVAMTMSAGDRLNLLEARALGGTMPLAVRLRGAWTGGLTARVDARRDDGSRVALGWFDVPDTEPFEVEVEWWSATAPGAADGGLRLRVNGQLLGEILGIDNDLQTVGTYDFGAMGVDLGTGGMLILDDFESWR